MTFDATVGGASANSYLAVAAADALAGQDMGSGATAWLAAQTAAKQTALQRATREVSAYVRSSGLARYSSTQALLYPRAVDVLSGTAFIPNAIQFATYAQAKFLNAGGADALDAAMARRAIGIQSGSEPNVSWSEGASLGAEPALCAEALSYLQGIFGRGASVRSVVIGTDYSYPITGDPGLDVLA